MAISVLKGDVKLQLTNLSYWQWLNCTVSSVSTELGDCLQLHQLDVLANLASYHQQAPCGPGAVPPPPYPFTSQLPHLFLYLLVHVSFTFFFSLSYLLHLFSYISIPSHSTRIVLFRFQGGCRGRRLNLALVF